jgi:DNA-directed RNA polymerase specialized sigma24 family protein
VASFDDLYERWFASVVAALWLTGADEPTAEDSAERAFVRTALRWRTVRDPVSFVLRSAFRAHARSQGFRRLRAAGRAPEPPSAALVLARGRVGAELLLLPRRARECAVLAWYLGCDPDATARILRTRASKVRRHLDVARRVLRPGGVDGSAAGP